MIKNSSSNNLAYLVSQIIACGLSKGSDADHHLIIFIYHPIPSIEHLSQINSHSILDRKENTYSGYNYFEGIKVCGFC